MIVTYTTPAPCEILRGESSSRSFATSPRAVILERSEESRGAIPLEDDNEEDACSRMTTQGEHGENPHQAVGVGAFDDPKNKGEAKRLPYGQDLIPCHLDIIGNMI